MDDLKTWILNVLSVPILAALGSAPCQPLEGGFTHISISMKRRLPLSPRLLPCLVRVVCKKHMLFPDLEFVASHVTIFGFKIKYCFYLGRSLRIHTNQIHFGHLVRRCFLPTIFYFLWACAEGVVHTQRAEILRFCMERQLKLLLCGFCYPNL